MLRSAALLTVAVLLAPPALAQRVVATDLANHPFTTDFNAGGKLRLRVRSAEVHILGTDEDRISVEASGRRARDVRRLKVEFERKGNAGDLRICGGSGDDLTITIRIPSNTDLHARIPFGEVHVENVTGSKDVSLHAGELTVDVGDPEDYARVDASVLTGELDAAPFDEYHGGLFRSFRTRGSGPHRLYAHVGAGELTLR
jgi:hypothetical protein